MPKLIMVIDDTQGILDLFRDILTNRGYAVSLHTYGKRELAEVRRIGPDLIISDWPPLDREMYGRQFLQMLKTTRETAHIPVVVCTTNLHSIQDNQAWMAANGIRVVAKPFEVDELFAAIEGLIGKADEPRPGPTATATEGLAGPHRSEDAREGKGTDTSPTG